MRVRSLDAICETFVPGAVEQGVPAAVLDALEHDLTSREQQRLQLLLRTWLPGFSRLSQPRREAVLRALARQPGPADADRFPGAAEGCARVRLHAARAAGSRSATQGRSAARGRARRRAWSRSRSARARRSSATCASSARAPAAASRRPCSPRRGSTSSCSRRAVTGRARLRRRGARRPSRASTAAAAPSATDDQGVGLIAGACLGGGTVVNYTTSFRTPDEVGRSGRGSASRPATTSAPASMPSASASASTQTTTAFASRRGAAARARVARLARRRDAPERARVRPGRRLRLLRLGCPLGAKRSTLRTWLEDAAAAGARIVVGAESATGARRARDRRRRRRGAGARCARGRWSPPRVRSTRLRCCCAPA